MGSYHDCPLSNDISNLGVGKAIIGNVCPAHRVPSGKEKKYSISAPTLPLIETFGDGNVGLVSMKPQGLVQKEAFQIL